MIVTQPRGLVDVHGRPLGPQVERVRSFEEWVRADREERALSPGVRAYRRARMVAQFSQNLLLANQDAAGTLFNTYTTAKSVINPTALVTLPPNYLTKGTELRIRVSGGISNVVTSQRTFTFQVMLGPTANIIVHTSGAITTTTTAHTLIPFAYQVDMRLDSVGSGTAAKWLAQGILQGQMWVYSGATADSVLGNATIMCPNTAPAVGTGFDSTVANILDFWVGLSASEATTGIQIYKYTVEQLGQG